MSKDLSYYCDDGDECSMCNGWLDKDDRRCVDGEIACQCNCHSKIKHAESSLRKKAHERSTQLEREFAMDIPVSSKAAEAPGGPMAGDFLLDHPDYEKWPRRSGSLITTLDDIQFDWQTVVKLMQEYVRARAAPAAPSERADEIRAAIYEEVEQGIARLKLVAPSLSEERERFEQWAASEYSWKSSPCARTGDLYADPKVEHAWSGWQARAGLSSQEGK